MCSDIVPNICYLDWDSTFFSLKIGKIEIPISVTLTDNLLSRIQERAIAENYNVIYFMFLDNIRPSINVSNFMFVDEKVVYQKEIYDNVEMNIPSHVLSYSSDYSKSDLYSLAFISGHCSRFKVDNNLPIGSFEAMYKIWIDNSISKEIADDILIYEKDNVLQGMLSYKNEVDKVQIGLFSVFPQNQHLGIGSKLMKYLEVKALLSSRNIITVATQGRNIQACRFYEKNGYKKNTVTNIYHLWL